ncbi:hypothetical protein TNCT_177461, partial [Trichonephila clavata]
MQRRSERIGSSSQQLIASDSLDGIVPEQERSMKTPSFISLWIVALCFLKTVYSCYLPYLSKSVGICDSLSKYMVDRSDWKAKDPSGTADCFSSPV